MKVLLLTDGSDHSLEAARWVVTLASKLREPAAVHVLHVHPPLPYPRAGEVVGHESVERYQRETSEEALAPATRLLREAGVSHESSWTLGEVAVEVDTLTRAGGFGLVVMGTHGHGAFVNLALGSVATKCIALLQVPIVVVPRKH